MSEFGYLSQDEDSHWYLIPENEITEFVEIKDLMSNDEENYELQDDFNRKYAKYRLSGGVESLRIPMSTIE